MFRLTNLIPLLASLCICAILSAQTNPSTSVSLPPGPIKVRITAVKGIVQFRTGGDAKWEKAAENTELTEGAELRTGPRSAVSFMIGDDQLVTLDRLGTIQILRAEFESGKVFTDLGMKYGRTRYDIESAARDHDAKVRSPSSVLAVRGTKFISEDQPPFTPAAVSLDGRVMFRDVHKQVYFGNKNQGKTRIDTQSDSAAKTALKTTAIVPAGRFTGASEQETDRLISTTFGGYENLGVFALLNQARLQNFTLIATIAVEQVNIGLTWTGATTSNVDLQVIEPNGTITDKNHTSNLRGYSAIPANNPSTPGFGQANVNLPSFATGTFTINATLTTTGPVSNVTVSATRDATSQFNDFATLTLQPFNLPQSGKATRTIKLNIEPNKPITDVTPAASSAKKVTAPPPIKTATKSRKSH